MKKPKTNTVLKQDGEQTTLSVHAADRADFTTDFAAPEFQAMMTEAIACDKSVRDNLAPKVLREEINRACDQVNAGDMSKPERMAMAQAHTLDALFHRLTQRAINNFGNTTWFEPYMRLALRAQAQSARTLETLAALKNPTVFAKQLNVANQQVVNNGGEPPPQAAAAPPKLREPAPIVPFAKTKIPAPAHERLDR